MSEEHHPHWVHEKGGMATVGWDGDPPHEVCAPQQAARREAAREGRVAGIVWLALAVFVIHTLLLATDGTIYPQGNMLLWLTFVTLLVTVPVALLDLGFMIWHRPGLPRQQAVRFVLLAVLIAGILGYVLSPGGPYSWPVWAIGFRARGSADRYQTWAVRLLQTPKGDLPWDDRDGQRGVFDYRRAPKGPITIAYSEVRMFGVTPDGSTRVITPNDPWYPAQRYVRIRYLWKAGMTVLLLGDPTFQPQGGTAVWKVQDGVYRVNESDER